MSSLNFGRSPVQADRIGTVTPGRRTAAAALLALVAVSATGCGNDSPAVRGDRLWGKLVVWEQNPIDGSGPAMAAPISLSDKISVTDYVSPGADPDDSSDDRVGTQLLFQELTFGDFAQLGEVISQAFGNNDALVDIEASRSGDIVAVSGNASLANADPDEAGVSISVQFPGPVSSTNATVQPSSDTSTWEINGGESIQLTAQSDYQDPATAAFNRWSMIVAFIGIVAAALTGYLAYQYRSTAPRPGRIEPEDSEPPAASTSR